VRVEGSGQLASTPQLPLLGGRSSMGQIAPDLAHTAPVTIEDVRHTFCSAHRLICDSQFWAKCACMHGTFPTFGHMWHMCTCVMCQMCQMWAHFPHLGTCVMCPTCGTCVRMCDVRPSHDGESPVKSVPMLLLRGCERSLNVAHENDCLDVLT